MKGAESKDPEDVSFAVPLRGVLSTLHPVNAWNRHPSDTILGSVESPSVMTRALHFFVKTQHPHFISSPLERELRREPRPKTSSVSESSPLTSSLLSAFRLIVSTFREAYEPQEKDNSWLEELKSWATSLG